MNQKIVIITGANSGIGEAASLKFATEGYAVVMACRNLDRSKVVQQKIIAMSNNSLVDLMELDISSFTSIKSFYESFTAKYNRLDILIHNAAYLNHGEKRYLLSTDGIELTFATNTFGPLLLTLLLREQLAQSQDPRILHACTTNIKHFFDPKRSIDFDNFRGEYQDSRSHNVYKMYGDSKMGLLLLTFKLAEELKAQGIKVNALQINRVKLSHETIQKMSPTWRWLAKAQNITNPEPSGMGDNYFHICTSDDFRDVTGQLINHKREVLRPASSHKGVAQIKNIFGSETYPTYGADKHHIEKMWDVSMAQLQGVI